MVIKAGRKIDEHVELKMNRPVVHPFTKIFTKCFLCFTGSSRIEIILAENKYIMASVMNDMEKKDLK